MRVAKTFLGVVLLALLAVLVVSVLIARVPPATIGVKQHLWGGGGVVEKDYETGFHLGVTGIHKWHMLDARTHFLTFASGGIATEIGQQRPSLEVRTKDNNRASYDVTVTYRITRGEAYLMVKEGLKNIYRDRVVATVESLLREELAQLSSESLYSTDERLDIARGALPKLAEAMAVYHVTPETVLIRAVSFPAAYERKLQEKQLTYQQRLLAQAKKKVEDQRAITETLSAEIEAAEKELRGDRDKLLQTVRSENEVIIAGIEAEARVYDKRVRAQAGAEYEKAVADGRLAIDKAEALRSELRNQALDTLGGRIFLAKQAADNLHFESVTLNSNDPKVPTVLDIGEMVKLLVGSADGED